MDNNIKRVIAAIEFIEAHLTDKLDLTTVANAVHYSKYHFHRVFAHTVGMSVHEYIQRRQLTEAAKLLVFSDKPIVDIAIMSGYESQQAFTNIFTAMYKQPPHRYRENEKFYPLQLKFRLDANYTNLYTKNALDWQVDFATEQDIDCWMELVRLVIDGFPHLQENEYLISLQQRIANNQALIIKDSSIAVGILLLDYQTSIIDFMGTHPLYRYQGVPKTLLNKVMFELLNTKEISITTYREGDKADTGHRQAIKDWGFAEAELLVEFGYPTQRFVLSREVRHE